MGFQDAFDETFFSCDLGAAKPWPAPPKLSQLL
jgi:hypothetical protein